MSQLPTTPQCFHPASLLATKFCYDAKGPAAYLSVNPMFGTLPGLSFPTCKMEFTDCTTTHNKPPMGFSGCITNNIHVSLSEALLGLRL